MPGLHPLAPNCGAAWSGTSAGTRNQSPAFKNPTSATDGSILRRLSLLRLNAEQKRGQSCGSRKILWVFREFTGLRCERILAHPFNDGVNAGLHVLRLSASSISSQPGTFESRVGGHFGDVRDQPKVADAASELLQDVFGKEKNPRRSVYGVPSLPLAPRSLWK